MALISQNKRLFFFDSPLGPDKLLVNRFHGTEAMSKLFHFDLELVSEDSSIDWYSIINRNVTVGIRQRDGSSFRYFNGHISKFAPMRHEGRLYYYRAEMVPWLWFLTLTQDCLIYQHKKVPEVVEATFKKFGFTNYDMSAVKEAEKHQPWENCCQYRETAFDFVSRLMEIEGIYYYFKHELGKHTMMIVNHKSSHLPCPYQSTFRVEHDVGTGVTRTEDTIFGSDMHKVVRPNQWAHTEFNFKIPNAPLLRQDAATSPTGANQLLEEYDFPGEYEHPDEAQVWGSVRQEEQVADHTTAHGGGNSRSLTPGYRFDLTEHDRPEQNINYLITSVTHTGNEGTFIAGSDAQEAHYENKFETIPSTVQFRQGRKTETPQMLGLQTAIVVGPKGEEIYTDEFGRVKVHFHWDRKPPDENSSCWIRVMQPWAGANFGHIFLPRVGMEVVVDFLEGDPDRPIIVGCIYNKDNQQPYPLPNNKNWSGFKTLSTKGGKPQKNFNELRFIDTMGSELFLLHAEKDMQITVENDTNEAIDRDRNLTVTRNQAELVKGHKDSTVQGEFRENVQGNMSLNIGGEANEKAGGNFILQAGGDIHLKAGGRIVLEAAQGTTFLTSGGTNFIDVNQSGIVIQGTTTWINSGMPNPGGALNAQPQTPAMPAPPKSETPAPPTPSQPNSSSPSSSSPSSQPNSSSSQPSSSSQSNPDGSQAGSQAGTQAGAAAGAQSAGGSSGAGPSSQSASSASALASNPWVAQPAGGSANAPAAAAPKPSADSIVKSVNPTNSTQNCGYIVDATISRLDGSKTDATAPADQDGSFDDLAQRHDTTIKWGQSFDDAFKAVKDGGDGTTAIVGIRYQGDTASHVVTMTNQGGTVSILEGQNWGAGNPQEVITDPARANQRYNSGGGSNIGYGIVGSP